MDSQDLFSPSNSEQGDAEMSNLSNSVDRKDNFLELHANAIENMQKPNVPNINVAEKIIICVDVCYDSQNSLYRLADGTSFTGINMLKRILDFFCYTKHAINKKTEFALIVLRDTEAFWVNGFTNNFREIISSVDHLNPEESLSDSFDFSKVFKIIKEKVNVPPCSQNNMVIAPRNVFRMIVIYGRSNCVPIIPQEDEFFNNLKKHLYFYCDILLAHEDDCALYKCEEIYDALQDLDNGYSYVYEVSRNAAKIHDYAAKLLAHPFQRPLQKNTDYTFGSGRLS